MTDPDPLRFPIGKFLRPSVPLDDDQRAVLIHDIARMPAGLRALVTGLSDAQLDTPYRPGGWTVRQVCHHVPDSHMNGYTRMKLAATEDVPTIKLYAEARWAELSEAKTGPVEVSLDLLDALHFRWTAFLRGLSPTDFHRTYVHPEMGPMSIDVAVALYAWHGKHHTAHVEPRLATARLFLCLLPKHNDGQENPMALKTIRSVAVFTAALLALALPLVYAGQAKVNVTGTWTFDVQTDAGGGTPTVTLTQDGEKLTGHYSSTNLGEADLSGTVKGNEIAFTFSANLQGTAVPVSYKGTIESAAAMKGTLNIGGVANGTFTAKKK